MPIPRSIFQTKNIRKISKIPLMPYKPSKDAVIVGPCQSSYLQESDDIIDEALKTWAIASLYPDPPIEQISDETKLLYILHNEIRNIFNSYMVNSSQKAHNRLGLEDRLDALWKNMDLIDNKELKVYYRGLFTELANRMNSSTFKNNPEWYNAFIKRSTRKSAINSIKL